jgi:hypothetical protein
MIRRMDREGSRLPATPVLAAPRREARSHSELTYSQPGLKQEVVADRLFPSGPIAVTSVPRGNA